MAESSAIANARNMLEKRKLARSSVEVTESAAREKKKPRKVDCKALDRIDDVFVRGWYHKDDGAVELSKVQLAGEGCE